MARNDRRDSPLSVDMRLVPWCVGGMALLAALWTALVVWNETQYGDHATWTLACQAIGEKIYFALPGIVLVPIIAVTGINLLVKIAKEFWRVITFNYTLIGKKTARKIAELRSEARAEGRAEKDAEWTAWNRRRLEAERDGVPFDEPPPVDDAR